MTNVHEVNQREAARICLAAGPLEESKLYNAIVKRFGLTLKQAKQGVKNSINSDCTIHRSLFHKRIYCRLATQKAPKGHWDFGTSPVDVNMTREEYDAFIAQRDAPMQAPWNNMTPLRRKLRDWAEAQATDCALDLDALERIVEEAKAA